MIFREHYFKGTKLRNWRLILSKDFFLEKLLFRKKIFSFNKLPGLPIRKYDAYFTTQWHYAKKLSPRATLLRRLVGSG